VENNMRRAFRPQQKQQRKEGKNKNGP